MEENQTTETNSSSSNMILVVVGVVIVALVAGGLWYSQMSANNNQDNNNSETMSDASTSDEAEMMPKETMEEEVQPQEAEMMEVEDTIDSEMNSDDDEKSADMMDVKEFTVSGNNFAFTPSTITVNQGDTVRIVFTNADGMHDWKIDEFNAATKVLKSGETETIEFVADKQGTFEYYCSVGKHREMGMKGTLTVQ